MRTHFLSDASSFALRAFSCVFLSGVTTSFAAAQDLGLTSMLKNGAVFAEDSNGKILASFHEDEPLMPASTAKLASTYCVLEEFGRDYRFKTEFLQGPGNTLYVKGSGDPGMVSEELAVIGVQLAKRMPKVDKIVIDTSYFEDDLVIDGASRSLNPYDSRNAAFVGNFSSAALSRKANGEVVSTEIQTPLTPLSRAAGKRLKNGVSERINLGHDWRNGVRYGGELLAAFLTKAGATGKMAVELAPIPSSATPLLEHTASKNLATLVQELLKYSTNFTANQLFLHLGAAQYGPPATVEKGRNALKHCLEKNVGWSNFHVEEGSGLSRKTRVTAKQLVQLLRKFEPYGDLLSSEDGFLAKTGTLTGANTLAGYFDSPRHGTVRFAILVNRNVGSAYKYEVARALRSKIK